MGQGRVLLRISARTSEQAVPLRTRLQTLEPVLSSYSLGTLPHGTSHTNALTVPPVPDSSLRSPLYLIQKIGFANQAMVEMNRKLKVMLLGVKSFLKYYRVELLNISGLISRSPMEEASTHRRRFYAG